MKKILYIDMDGVLVNFKSAFPKISKDTLTEYDGCPDEVPGIFSKMEPNPGALDAFKQLSKIFDTYILSTSPWENPSAWTDKLNWVKKHLGEHAYKRLILTHHKNLNRGDFLVDDQRRNGADNFKREHIHFRTEKFPDWNAVLNYLMEKA